MSRFKIDVDTLSISFFIVGVALICAAGVATVIRLGELAKEVETLKQTVSELQR